MIQYHECLYYTLQKMAVSLVLSLPLPQSSCSLQHLHTSIGSKGNYFQLVVADHLTHRFPCLSHGMWPMCAELSSSASENYHLAAFWFCHVALQCTFMVSTTLNTQSGLKQQLVDWRGRRTPLWHTLSVDPTVFLVLGVRCGGFSPTEGPIIYYQWSSPSQLYHAIPTMGQQTSRNNAAVLERLALSSTGWSLK